MRLGAPNPSATMATRMVPRHPFPPMSRFTLPIPQMVDGAIARVLTFHRRLPEDDGVWWFNRMYLMITEQVRDNRREAPCEISELGRSVGQSAGRD
jgi:hypothetical protein